MEDSLFQQYSEEGRELIRKAYDYAQKHNYLYFCADPSFNGSHRFAATYTEHLNNARAFQRALDARTKR